MQTRVNGYISLWPSIKLSPEVVKVPLIESSLRSPSSLPSSDFVHFFLPCQILHDHQTCKPSLSAGGLHQGDHHQFYCHQIRTRGPATKVGRGHQRKNVSLYSQTCVQQSKWPALSTGCLLYTGQLCREYKGTGKLSSDRNIQGDCYIQVNFAENIRELGSYPVTVIYRVSAIYRSTLQRI